MADERYEGGTAPLRTEFVRESTVGEAPADPEFEPFSDNIPTHWGWEPDNNMSALRGAGDIDPVGFFAGPETHEASFTYHLQRWFVDGSGNAQDAAADAMLRADDNSYNNTHTVTTREVHTRGGSDGAGRRIYVVGKGGYPASVTVPFVTEDGEPVAITLSYQFEKVRVYDISQPSSSTTLDVQNTGTSSVDVTIEDEGAATTETTTVSGGSTDTTTETFADIDAIDLSAAIDGDIVVSDGSGTTFATINGADSYDVAEGDQGIPALGSGSHAGTVGSSYVIFNDDTLDFDGTAIAPELVSGELSVDNGLEASSRDQTQRMAMAMGDRTVTVDASVFGPNVSKNQIQGYLQTDSNKIVWTADEGTVEVPTATRMSGGTVEKEAGTPIGVKDVEFQGTGVSLS